MRDFLSAVIVIGGICVLLFGGIFGNTGSEGTQTRSRPKKQLETYGDCGTGTGRDDRTNEKIHMMTCRGYGRNGMLLAFVTRNQAPQLEMRFATAHSGKNTKRFSGDTDGPVEVTIQIDKRQGISRVAHWNARADMATLHDNALFPALLKDVAKGFTAVVRIGDKAEGTVSLSGSAAAIRDLRERAREFGIP